MLQDMRAEAVRNRKIIAPLGKAAMAVFSEGVFCVTVKNKPPAMQGERSSLDISMSSCARINVGLQNHK